MDIRKIKKLIELIEESGILEIEIKEGEESVRLSRHNPHSLPIVQYSTHTAPPPITHAASPVASLPALESATPPAVPNGHTVRSPMVGTAYLSPSPEAKSFVTIGQTVRIGETLCIIEAMKMFNEVEADRNGVIQSVLIKNGDPVEYDAPLFVIE